MPYHSGRIVAKRAVSPTVTLLDLYIPQLEYQPGQWLDFMIPTATWIGGFSIASGPGEEVIQIAVKESTTHPAAQWVTTESNVGDDIRVQVGGTCLLSTQSQTMPSIFVAGGIGISPLLGLYRQHLGVVVNSTRPPRPPVKFFYSVRTEDEVVFRNELTELLRPEDTLTITLTQSSDWKAPGVEPNICYHVGRGLTGFLVMSRESNNPENSRYSWKDAIYYICGPPSMQDDALTTLQNVGVPNDRLFYERWW